MYSFTVNLDLFSPSTMALESDLFHLLLSIEDDNNQKIHIKLPSATTTDTVLCLLDFLGESAAADRVFMAISDAATLHNAWNRVYCDCQIDTDGNMLWPDITQAEGSRFQIRAKQGVAPYAILPTLALWHIVAEPLRNGPFFLVP